MHPLNGSVTKRLAPLAMMILAAVGTSLVAQTPGGPPPPGSGAMPPGGPPPGGPPPGGPPPGGRVPGGPPPGGGAPRGPTVSSTQAKVTYPNGVEGLFDITYASVAGVRPLKLDVYVKPGGTKPKPVLVFVHGGGFMGGSNRAIEQPWGEMDHLMARIAGLGYVVVAPTYRLANEAKFPSQIQDVKSSIRWIRANAAKYGADPQRVGIWGTSVGGSVAATVGTSCGAPFLEGEKEGNADQSSCVIAAADWFGVTDMKLLDVHKPAGGLVHNSPDASQTTYLGCIINQCDQDFVERANPLSYIDESDRRTSFLIAHGQADTAVGWQQSQILNDALRAKGIKSTLTLVPGAGHYWANAPKAQTDKLLDDVLAFFASTLKP